MSTKHTEPDFWNTTADSHEHSKRKPVSQWTQEERLAWGRSEDEARERDLQMAVDADSLKVAQQNAAKRRNAVGASMGQAMEMVREAQRSNRRGAL